MRTAGEYISEYEPNSEYTSYYHELYIESMINNARKECIEECAKSFIINEGECGEFGNYKPPFIEPESVLNLINEIK